MKLTVAIDLVAVISGLPDQPGLPGIFPGALAQRGLPPCVVAAGLHSQAAAHRPNPEMITMLGNERVSHLASLAKYAVAFLKCRAPR